MKKSLFLSIISLLFISGCAAVIEGRSQEVVVKTNPEGARCTLVRNDIPLGTILTTPGTLYIKKTKDDISIKCVKMGYKNHKVVLKSGSPKDNLLYILVGGPIGWGVDSATGSDNYYQSPVMIEMQKK